MKCANILGNGYCGSLREPSGEASLKCPFRGDQAKCLSDFLNSVLRVVPREDRPFRDGDIQICFDALIKSCLANGFGVAFWRDLALNMYNDLEKALLMRRLSKDLELPRAS